MLRLLFTAIFVNCTRDLDPYADRTSRPRARSADLTDLRHLACIGQLAVFACFSV